MIVNVDGIVFYHCNCHKHYNELVIIGNFVNST
jgi:hypothetical protein